MDEREGQDCCAECENEETLEETREKGLNDLKIRLFKQKTKNCLQKLEKTALKLKFLSMLEKSVLLKFKTR